MMDLLRRGCVRDGYVKVARFSSEDHKSGVYCRQHARDDVVDVKTKHCAHEGRIKIPSFSSEARPVCAAGSTSLMGWSTSGENPSPATDGCSKIPR